MRRSATYPILIAVLAVIALLAVPATAGAGPAILTGKVTGSVQLGGPLQYVSFNAFDFANAPDRGQVSYTNFEADEEGTGTWVPQGSYAMGIWNHGELFYIDFGYMGGTYPHAMQFDSFTPLSYNSVAFEAHGYYGADPDFKWDATGTISGNEIDFLIEVTNDPGGLYRWTRATVEGRIDYAGQASGTALDDYVDIFDVPSPRALTWTFRADSADTTGVLEEVRSFSVPVTCAEVSPTNRTASFTSVIPAGLAGAGNSFLITVTDNEVPGTTDVYNHGYATSGCVSGSLYGPYPITGGNLTVHK